MSNLKQEFDRLSDQLMKLKEEFQTVARDLFKQQTKEFFQLVPQVKAFRWTQYTPYFNDGDTCEFGVNDVYFTNAEGKDLNDVTSWGDYDGENENIWSESSYIFDSMSEYYAKRREELGVTFTPEQVRAIVDISNMIQSHEMKDIMEAMFGDHVVITATAAGFDVEEHEHD